MIAAVVVLASAMIFSPSAKLFRSESPRLTEGWLGLYCNQTCALRPASIEYATFAGEPDRLDAYSRPRKAYLMFRDVPGVSAGPVVEAKYDLDVTLGRGSVVPIRLGGDEYELRVTASDDFLNNGVVTLRRGERSQVVYRMPESIDEGHLALVFAGDLDRDGRLDLVMVNSPKYSVSPLTLYLSGAAGEGELLREAARWEHYSC